MADETAKNDKPIFGRPWIFIRAAGDEFLPPEGPLEIALPPLECRQVVADQCLVGHKGSLALQYAGPHAELNYFVPTAFPAKAATCRRWRWSTCQAMATRRREGACRAWTKLVFDYLRGRSTLKRVYLLIDSRHGIKKNDEDVMTLLDKAAVSYQWC